MSELTFDPPGPGTWELDEAHFSKPFSRWMQAVFPPAMSEGFGQSMAHYGTLLDAPEIEPVNGFLYLSMRPVVGPVEADEPPPKLLFTLMKWFHPTLRRRFARIEETFETKRWRADMERWDSEWMPERLAENRSLQAVDLADLSDAELADHAETCRQTATDAIVLHHRMDLCPLLPMGDFLAHATDWTDRSPGALLGLFEGASPISAGAIDELETAVARIADDDDARERLLDDADPAATLDALRSRSGPVGTAVEEWLEVIGYRVVSGYDVADIYALENPEMLISTLRTALDGDFEGPVDHDSSAAVAAVRSEVPAAHRETFDDLYEEARATYRIRDERSLTDLWTLGLARRALLEVGRRLTDRGMLHDPSHAVDLTPEEVVTRLRHGEGPSADEVADYVDHRQRYDNDDAPSRLGPEAPPTPPLEWLPDPAARGMQAVEMMMGHMFAGGDEASDQAVVRGLAASDGAVEGTVRVVSGPDDFGKIQEGDVLVAETTSPAFNVVLPLLGGVVTDNGGVLSHAAIVAREFGIPGVVGCTDATTRLEDGMHVAVDGGDGTVRLLS